MTDHNTEQSSTGATEPAAEPESPADRAAPEQGSQDAPGETRANAGSAPESELQSLRDRYLRLAAEYDNFRKRTERERSEAWTRAQAQVVQQLLDALDDLQRVAHFNTETASVQSLLDGVQMVERKLFRVLEGAGLEVVDASGRPFDPSVHEALMTTAADRQEDDESVGQVFQQGYRFKGELLRPARVQVRKFEG